MAREGSNWILPTTLLLLHKRSTIASVWRGGGEKVERGKSDNLFARIVNFVMAPIFDPVLVAVEDVSFIKESQLFKSVLTLI